MEWLLNVSQIFGPALNGVGIIGGLLGSTAALGLTVLSLRADTKTQKVGNLISLTQNHRELWFKVIDNPALGRVLDPTADLRKQPVTLEEHLFVTEVTLHLSCTFEAIKDNLLISQEGLRRDVATFFPNPVPKTVWHRIKPVQNDAFVNYVESCLRWK